MTVGHEARDLCFVRGTPVALDDLGSGRDLIRRGLGDPKNVGQRAALGGGGGLPGEREEGGALSFAQVIPGGLAGDGGVTEDAQVIVAQLERQAPRGEDCFEDVQQLGDTVKRGCSADRAKNGGVDDRVVCRLV